jgi:MarR family transcriptional regulator for hemolysin
MNIIEQSNEFCVNYLHCIKKSAVLLNISQSQALCIQTIPYDGISQTNLAKKLFLDLSTLSRNLEKLSKLGFIIKESSPFDSRSYIITLSKSGKEIYHSLNMHIQNYLSIIYDSLELHEIDTMVDLLNKINWKFTLLHNE